MELQAVYGKNWFKLANQTADRMEDRDFENLKDEIRHVQIRLDRLQALYRNQVGRDYRPAPR